MDKPSDRGKASTRYRKGVSLGALIDKEDLKARAIKAIEENKLIFLEDICAFTAISTATLYSKFPVDSEDLKELKDLLDKNKVTFKTGLRKKWFDGDNATTQLALYKLCSTNEEHKKLSQNSAPESDQSDKANDFTLTVVNAPQ